MLIFVFADIQTSRFHEEFVDAIVPLVVIVVIIQDVKIAHNRQYSQPRQCSALGLNKSNIKKIIMSTFLQINIESLINSIPCHSSFEL